MRSPLLPALLAIATAGCFSGPPPVHLPNPERDRRREALHREIAAQLKAVPGTVSLYFKDLDTDETLAYDADRVFRAAPLVTLFILVETHQRAYEGTLDLDAEADLADHYPSATDGRAFAAGDEAALRRAAGPRPTARRLCEEMIVASSNSAANNLMLRLGGPAAVEQAARARGFAHTTVPRHLEDEAARRAGRNPATTPADVGALMERLARRLVVSPGSSAEMARLLTRARGGFLARDLPPEEVEIAHKPAAGAGVRHDAGFVTCANGTYVLVVLMQDLADDPAGEAAGAMLSRRCYDYMQSRPR